MISTPKRKAVTTTDKREELAALGEEWPLYPDGTRQHWQSDYRCRQGGYWRSFERTEAARASDRDVNRLDRRRRRAAARSGRLPNEKRRTSSEVGAFARRVQGLRRIHDDQVAMKMLEERNPKRAKLIRLALHPATPPFERRRALDRLMPKEHTHGG